MCSSSCTTTDEQETGQHRGRSAAAAWPGVSQSLVKAPQNGSTRRRVQAILAPEDSCSAVPREVVDSHGEGALSAIQGGQVGGLFRRGITGRSQSNELRRRGRGATVEVEPVRRGVPIQVVQDRVGGESRGSCISVNLRGGGSSSVPGSSWGTRVSACAGGSQELSLSRGCGLSPSSKTCSPFKVQSTGHVLADASHSVLALFPATNSLSRRHVVR